MATILDSCRYRTISVISGCSVNWTDLDISSKYRHFGDGVAPGMGRVNGDANSMGHLSRRRA